MPPPGNMPGILIGRPKERGLARQEAQIHCIEKITLFVRNQKVILDSDLADLYRRGHLPPERTGQTQLRPLPGRLRLSSCAARIPRLDVAIWDIKITLGRSAEIAAGLIVVEGGGNVIALN
jgi:hypothetical protein